MGKTANIIQTLQKANADLQAKLDEAKKNTLDAADLAAEANFDEAGNPLPPTA